MNVEKGLLINKQLNNRLAKKLNLALEMLYSNRAPMAMPLFEELAEFGNLTAINILGDYYRFGWGCETDFKKSVQFYMKAADGEYGEALVNLGEMYESGDGIKKNYKKAFECYEKAIECNYIRGYLGLARLYYLGKGVKKDLRKNFEYVKICADEGDILAIYDIGWAYEYGVGVESNISLAIEWLSVAADQGENADACIELVKIYQDEKLVQYNPQLAFYYAKRASELGSAEGDYYLSMFYATGEVVAKDQNKFLDLINRAIDNGSIDATYFLGRAYFEEEYGLPLDIDKAENYFNIVSEQESGGWSDYYLGVIYWEPTYGRINYRKARFYFERVTENPSVSEGCYELARIYEYGLGTKRDIAKAIKYCRRGARKGCPYCMVMYGEFYEIGKYFEKNSHLAYKWYKKSMDSGCEPGYSAVMSCYAFGIGVKQNLKKVREMRDLAIENNILKKDVVNSICYEGERKDRFKRKVMKNERNEIMCSMQKSMSALIASINDADENFGEKVGVEDVCKFLNLGKHIMVGDGTGNGEQAADEALDKAIANVEKWAGISHAKGLAYNIVCNDEISKKVYDVVSQRIFGIISNKCKILYGLKKNNTLQDEVRITLVVVW